MWRSVLRAAAPSCSGGRPPRGWRGAADNRTGRPPPLLQLGSDAIRQPQSPGAVLAGPERRRSVDQVEADSESALEAAPPRLAGPGPRWRCCGSSSMPWCRAATLVPGGRRAVPRQGAPVLPRRGGRLGRGSRRAPQCRLGGPPGRLPTFAWPTRPAAGALLAAGGGRPLRLRGPARAGARGRTAHARANRSSSPSAPTSARPRWWAVAALANGLAFRDKAFLAFALYIGLLGAGQMGRAGIGAQYLWPDAGPEQHAAGACGRARPPRRRCGS